MVCSNQVRINVDGGQYAPKYTTPGGEAVAFYSSCRLKTKIVDKIKRKKKFHGEEVTRIIGVEIEVEVFKNSIWKPYRVAPVTIIFDYGIDNILTSLYFLYSLKTDTGKNTANVEKEIVYWNDKEYQLRKLIRHIEQNTFH